MTFPHLIDDKNPNGELWNTVSKTDPAHVKEVRKGARKFSAIDAYSQIKAATALFGPVGQGWGWVVKDTKFWGEAHGDNHTNLCMVHITLWWKPVMTGDTKTDNPFDNDKREFDAIGMNIISRRPKDKDYVSLDDDCMKKALTDAITKGLSYLGFNADVFFGAFDDNKYVADLEREIAERAQQPARTASAAAGPTADAGAGTQASSPPDTPRKRHDGMPAWFSEPIGGSGRFKDKDWEYLTLGGPDGGRHGWLRSVFTTYHDEKLLKRISWILSKFYGDNEAKDGKLLPDRE